MIQSHLPLNSSRIYCAKGRILGYKMLVAFTKRSEKNVCGNVAWLGKSFHSEINWPTWSYFIRRHKQSPKVDFFRKVGAKRWEGNLPNSEALFFSMSLLQHRSLVFVQLSDCKRPSFRRGGGIGHREHRR